MSRKIETAANIISDVEQLKKTVYTGNGEPSLTSQMSSLNTKVEYLEKQIISKNRVSRKEEYLEKYNISKSRVSRKIEYIEKSSISKSKSVSKNRVSKNRVS